MNGPLAEISAADLWDEQLRWQELRSRQLAGLDARLGRLELYNLWTLIYLALLAALLALRWPAEGDGYPASQ